MQGWTRRIAPDAEVAPRAIDGIIESEMERHQPGDGEGKWSNQKEIERAAGVAGRYQEFDRMALDAGESFVRSHFADASYDRPGCHRPTMLKVSLLQPHYPFFTTPELFEYYLNRVPLYSDEPQLDHPKLGRSQNMADVRASERDVRRATAAYYGMVESVDAGYRRILDRLRHVGEDLDDWIIVYTSDHGEMLGEHGIWEKTQMFDASARVPLIVRWPRRFAHRVVQENVNLCDLFATLCDLADIPLPEAGQTVRGAGLDSRSLVPLMEGQTDEWYERYLNETISQFNGTDLMIKRDSIKYCQYNGPACVSQPEVLFDLQADPTESRNLIDEQRYAPTIQAFRTRAAALGFGPQADEGFRNAGYA